MKPRNQTGKKYYRNFPLENEHLLCFQIKLTYNFYPLLNMNQKGGIYWVCS